VETNLDLHLVDADSVSASDRQWTVGSEQWAVDTGH
jgi:hypothetical protein